MIRKSDKSISAVIVNHNGGRKILQCIGAVKKQNIAFFQIIVVDNASTDGSPSEIAKRFPEVILVRLNENFGPCKSKNLGLELARSELVLLLDDDVYVQPGCIRTLCNVYEHYLPAVVCPRVVLYPDTHIVQCDGAWPHFIGTLKLRNAFCNEKLLSRNISEVWGCIGACMLVHRDTVISAGGFDEMFFFYFDDLEFSLKIRSLGHSIICEPQAVVFHDRGDGRPGLSFRGEGQYPEKRAYLHIRNRLMTILIHYHLRTLILLSPAFVLYEISVLMATAKRGYLRAWYKAMLSVYENLGYISLQRQIIKTKKKRCDKDLLGAGNLPVAPGLIMNQFENIGMRMLSFIVNLYWRAVKSRIG
ncbi:MAG: glycosyltransferase family 2 protein [Desulfobacteraceae bacterium]|jgi:GT2 family glycosyltransferase|nr:MAG: glycosyltransferase family 2 protein [Desulfobacteraceae bacterium]